MEEIAQEFVYDVPEGWECASAFPCCFAPWLLSKKSCERVSHGGWMRLFSTSAHHERNLESSRHAKMQMHLR